MSDELDLDLDAVTDPQPQEKNRVENRIKDLSDKYAKEAEERKKAEAEKTAALREVEFYKGFTPLTSKYQAAGEFQDKIREKVLSGYEVEDATVAVLSREGRLQTGNVPPAEPPKPKESPVGGSAPNTIRNQDKTYSEMSQSEKRDELIKIEQESGALSSLFNRHL